MKETNKKRSERLKAEAEKRPANLEDILGLANGDYSLKKQKTKPSKDAVTDPSSQAPQIIVIPPDETKQDSVQTIAPVIAKPLASGPDEQVKAEEEEAEAEEKEKRPAKLEDILGLANGDYSPKKQKTKPSKDAVIDPTLTEAKTQNLIPSSLDSDFDPFRQAPIKTQFNLAKVLFSPIVVGLVSGGLTRYLGGSLVGSMVLGTSMAVANPFFGVLAAGAAVGAASGMVSALAVESVGRFTNANHVPTHFGKVALKGMAVGATFGALGAGLVDLFSAQETVGIPHAAADTTSVPIHDELPPIPVDPPVVVPVTDQVHEVLGHVTFTDPKLEHVIKHALESSDPKHQLWGMKELSWHLLYGHGMTVDPASAHQVFEIGKPFMEANPGLHGVVPEAFANDLAADELKSGTKEAAMGWVKHAREAVNNPSHITTKFVKALLAPHA